MNERIKELAKQSGFHFYDMHDIDGEDYGESVESDSFDAVNKFAELIIQECVKAVYEHDSPKLSGPSISYANAILTRFEMWEDE